MPLVSCEISLDLTWFEKCVISSAAGKTEFAIICKILCFFCNFIN